MALRLRGINKKHVLHATVKNHKVAMVIKYFFVNFAAHLATKSSKSDIKKSVEKVNVKSSQS